MDPTDARWQTSSERHPVAAPPRRLYELDLLRFIASLAVVGFHFIGMGANGPWTKRSYELLPNVSEITRHGHLGANLFFIISGFVILMSAWGRSPGRFAVSRMVRLYPAYWVSVLFGVALIYLTGVGKPEGLDLRSILVNLTMLQDGTHVPNVEGPYWTLLIELRFYVLIGLFAWWGITYRRALVFMWAFLATSLLIYPGPSSDAELELLGYAPYFVAGMALYLIYRNGSTHVLWATFTAALAVAAWRAPLMATSFIKGPAQQRPYITVTLVIAMFAVMALVATHKLNWINWKGLTTVGALTYPLYLLHDRIGMNLAAWLEPHLPPLTILPFYLTLSLATAWLAQRYIEQPIAPRLRGLLTRP